MKKISIIIPAYNVEGYISRCLESLVNQTINDIEIIVIDDGSIDNTYSIACDYSKKDNRIKVFTQENQKQGAARNEGLKMAQAEYIAFVDSDDFIELNYCEELYNTAKKYNADIVTTNMLKHKKKYNKYNVFYKEIKEVVVLEDKINLCKDRTQRFFYVMNRLFKRSFIDENNIFFSEGCFFEDVMFMTKAIFKANKIVSCPSTTYHYIENPASTVKSSENQEKKKEDRIQAYKELQGFAKEKNIKLPERLNYFESYWENYFIKTYNGVYKTKRTLFGILPIWRFEDV